MKRRQFFSLLGGIALAPRAALPVYADPPGDCGIPVARDDGWPIAPVNDDTLVDRDALCMMADRLVASSANVHAVLVARAGRLVFERYFKGSDEMPCLAAAHQRARPSRPTRRPSAPSAAGDARAGRESLAETAGRETPPMRETALNPALKRQAEEAERIAQLRAEFARDRPAARDTRPGVASRPRPAGAGLLARLAPGVSSATARDDQSLVEFRAR